MNNSIEDTFYYDLDDLDDFLYDMKYAGYSIWERHDKEWNDVVYRGAHLAGRTCEARPDTKPYPNDPWWDYRLTRRHSDLRPDARAEHRR